MIYLMNLIEKLACSPLYTNDAYLDSCLKSIVNNLA
jgi:hypothetical protein